MISLPFSMIFRAVVICVISGVIFGTVYSVIHGVLFRLIIRKYTAKDDKFKIGNSFRIQHSNIFDFIFFSVMSVIYILINYAICDGVITFYPMLFLLISFLLTCALWYRIIKS